MSYALSTLTACETVQKMLFEAPEFTQFDFTANREVKNFLNYIVSPANSSGIVQSVVPGGGRTRTVRVVYSPRYLTSETTNDLTSFNCVSTNDIGDLSTTYSINTDNGVMFDKRITLSDLEDKCQDDQFYVARTIRQIIDVCTRELARKVAVEAALLNGNWNTMTQTTGGNLIVQTKNAAGQFVNDALTSIDLAFEEMELPMNLRPIIFGAKEWSEYWKNLKHGCCSDAQAINLGTFAQEYSLGYLYSKDVHRALNANVNSGSPVALAVLPGALQLLQFNKYDGERGIRKIDTETEKAGLVTDPMTGITWDYYAKYDCEVWSFVIRTAAQLVGMPNDMFSPGDDNNGVNGVFNLQIVNP